MVLNGNKVEFNLTYQTQFITTVLLDNLRKTTGCKILGFFIPPHQQAAFKEACRFNPKVRGYQSQYSRFRKSEDREWDAKALKAYKEDKFLIFENLHGFDMYTIVAPGEELNIEEVELEANSEMTRGQFVKAFSEFSLSKKANRVFITKFAKVVS
jgi:hypothetical protein